MEQSELKLPPIEYSAIHNFYEDCVQLFDCAWVIHTFPENEMEEMFTRSLRFYKGPDIDKRKRCWRTYNDLLSFGSGATWNGLTQPTGIMRQLIEAGSP